LVDAGFQAEIYWRGLDDNTARLDAVLGPTPASVVSSWTSHRTAGLVLATDPVSASYVNSNVVGQTRGYLVQDHSTLAHSGDGLILSEHSYTYNLSHFTLGNWLTHMINSRYHSPAFPAEQGVDTRVYKIQSDATRDSAICMYCPPGQPGPLSRLALDALALVKKRRPETRIILFGSEEPPHLHFEHENFGVLREPKAIAELFNQCAAGLALDMSNPSRRMFEMAAAGCTPVGLYRYNNVMDLNDKFSVLAYQSAHSIAEALSRVIDQYDHDQRRPQSVASQFYNRTLIWERDAAVANIISVLEGKDIPSWSLSPLYNAEPVIAPADDNAAVRAFCRQQLPFGEQGIW
jgi:hypothetical protein